MKKLAFLFVLVLGISGVSRAQNGMDFGLNLGVSTYIGEIGEPGISDGFLENPFPLHIVTDQARYNLGLFYRYNFTHNIAARFEANWIRISGADSLSSEPTRIARNLSFRTDIFEFSLLGEYAWWIKNDISRNSRIDFRADVHAGIGYALYNPMGQLDGKWYDLRPLATEGIDNEYENGTLIVPFGVGASWIFNKKIRAGVDFTYRFTFTDYLDDVSTRYPDAADLPSALSAAFSSRSDEAFARGNTDLPDQSNYTAGSRRGNPETNDAYFMMQFKVSYVLDPGNGFYRSKYRGKINRRRNRTKF